MTIQKDDCNKKIIIAGRAHSGKTRLAGFLSEELGLKLLKTCTTRPRRTPDEDTYHFYTEAEAAGIPESEKLFRTFAVDGYERWAGKSEFLEAGIAVLDMTGVPQAVRLWQAYGYSVCIIYVAADTDVRHKTWIQCALSAGKDEGVAVQAFEEQDFSEAPMFDQFEARIQNGYDNHFFGEDRLDVWKNTYNPVDMNAFIRRLYAEIRSKNNGSIRLGRYREFHGMGTADP